MKFDLKNEPQWRQELIKHILETGVDKSVYLCIGRQNGRTDAIKLIRKTYEIMEAARESDEE